MLCINETVHVQLSAALERVRAGADIMPRKQLEKAIIAELGSDWRTKLADFDFEPLAAASIGQVIVDPTSLHFALSFLGLEVEQLQAFPHVPSASPPCPHGHALP